MTAQNGQAQPLGLKPIRGLSIAHDAERTVQQEQRKPLDNSARSYLYHLDLLVRRPTGREWHYFQVGHAAKPVW